MGDVDSKYFAALTCQQLIRNFPHFLIGIAEFFEARIFLAQKVEQVGQRIFGRILEFEESVGLAFFGRPKLREVRMGNTGVVIIDALHFLFQGEGGQPDVPAISFNIVDEEQLHDGLIGRPIEFCVQISDDFLQALHEGLADGFDVGGFSAGLDVFEVRIGIDKVAAEARQFLVQTSDFELRSRGKPFDGAEHNAGVPSVKFDGDGRKSVRLDGIFDCGDDNGIFYDRDDDPAGSKINDQFFTGSFVCLLGRDGKRQ